MTAADQIIVQSPTSYTGATRRIWRLTRLGPPAAKWATIPAAVILCAVAWVLCTVWLVLFGLLMVPWRLLRRGQRKRKQEARRHAELLAAAQRTPVA